MKKFRFICNIRGFILSKWYGIETEGHFFAETLPGAFYCRLCGDEVFSLARQKFTKKLIVNLGNSLLKRFN